MWIPPTSWRVELAQWSRSWRAWSLTALALVLATTLWALPQRQVHIESADGQIVWAPASPTSEWTIRWRPAAPLDEVVMEEPPRATSRQLGSPCLADQGSTLYYTATQKDGTCEIHQAFFRQGRWQSGHPVPGLNSDADDVSPVISPDGQQLWFASNREAGHGGFDLYRSLRRGHRWSPPENLGPRINSPAHELSPTLAPGHQTLYFASDRASASPGTPSPGVYPFIGGNDTPDGPAIFNIYSAYRASAGSDWNPAQPVAAANRSNAHDAFPRISPDGAFLYFASNRPGDTGARQFDIYRLPLHTHEPAKPLGPEINSPANEWAPSLSRNGFQIIFASNRSGPRQWLECQATPTVTRVSWDHSRSALLASVWLPALLITLGLSLPIWLLWHYRRPLLARAGSGRFAAASVIVHVLLLVALAFWSLPTVIQMITSDLQEADAGSQPFDDNQHESHEEGQELWEKLADLQAVRPTVDLERQIPDPNNIPAPSDRLQPTISLREARSLPTDHVLYEPPPQPRHSVPPALLPARALSQTPPPVEVSEPNIEPAPAEASDTEPTPVRPAVPLDRGLASIRAPEPVPAPQIAPPRIPAVLPAMAPVAPSLDEPPESSPRRRPPSGELQLVVSIVEDPTEPIVPLSKQTTLPQPVTDPGPLPRGRVQASVEPRPLPPVPATAARPAPPTTATDPGDIRPASPSLAPPRPSRSLPPVLDLAAAEPDPAPTLATAPAMQSPEPPTPLTRFRPTPPPRLDVPTPSAPSGPARLDRPLTVGTQADRLREVPPAFGPIVSPLNRPRAKAKKVIYAQDSVGMQELFTLRQGDIRKQYIKLFGGTEESEVSVNRGLQWLVDHQNPDGSWSLNQFQANCKGKHANCNGRGSVKSNTAATGLALLPLLAAGSTHLEGPHHQQVAAGVQWLIQTQNDKGSLLGPGDQQVMYSHCIAAIALCEAYGMSRDTTLKPAAEKALKFIVLSQHKGTGGWRYNPNQAADTSVVGWGMMALKSGEIAGIPPAPAAIQNVERWLKRVEGNRPVGGMFGYQNKSVNPSMTAEGLLCRQFMNAGRNSPAMRAGADYLMKHLPQPNQRLTSYYWYYATQVMYHMGGKYWETWNGPMRDHLISSQRSEGPMAGTWDPRDNWEKSGGRVYATALKLLILEVYYRHLPLYEQLEE